MNSSLRSKRRMEYEGDSRPASGRGLLETAATFQLRSERQPTTQNNVASNETTFRADMPITSLPCDSCGLPAASNRVQPIKSGGKKQNKYSPFPSATGLLLAARLSCDRLIRTFHPALLQPLFASRDAIRPPSLRARFRGPSGN